MSFADFQNSCPRKVMRSFSGKLHSIEVHTGTTQNDRFWASVFIRTSLSMTCEHAPIIENSIMGGIKFFQFSFHVRASIPVIFGETPLSWSTLQEYKLGEYQLVIPTPLVMTSELGQKIIFPLWEKFFLQFSKCIAPVTVRVLQVVSHTFQHKIYRLTRHNLLAPCLSDIIKACALHWCSKQHQEIDCRTMTGNIINSVSTPYLSKSAWIASKDCL